MSEQSKYDIVGWRAWYTDGRTFDSTTTAWEDLPADGALSFMLYSGNAREHRRIMSGVSLYWKEETDKGTIYACDNAADALIPENHPANLIKRGKWTTDDEFKTAYDRMLASEPPKQ